MSEVPPAQLQNIVDKITRCRAVGSFTDLTIICDGTKFEVHKLMLCSQSSVFHAACTSNFKEATSGTYEMVNESKIIVEKMLDFLYTGDYSSVTSGPENEELLSISALQIHARLFALADKYAVSELCDTAAERYMSKLENDFNPFEFLESIPDIYFSTKHPNGKLRENVLRFSRDNFEYLLRDRSTREAYDTIAAHVPSFVKDMLDTYIDAPLLGDCSNCGLRKPMLPLQARCRSCRRGRGIDQWSRFSLKSALYFPIPDFNC